jgi:heme A synthase
MVQAALGVATLISSVPILLALAHQALALAVFGLAVIHLRVTEMEQAA